MWLINATCKFKKTTFFFFKEIEFVDGYTKLKSYIEVYLEQPVEFKLLLVGNGFWGNCMEGKIERVWVSCILN